jgi:hypothetical protein
VEGVVRHAWAGICLVVIVVAGGCGGNEMSLTEYVERLNAITDPAIQKGAELIAEAEQITDLTPQRLQAGLEFGLREIRVPLQGGADAIEPPEPIADLHYLMWDWHSKLIFIEEALATRAGTAANTAADWEALSESPEMAAYRAVLTEGKQVCSDFQAELDARAEGGGFAIDSWLAADLEEIGNTVLGCEFFPEYPEDVYRYPPPTSTP